MQTRELALLAQDRRIAVDQRTAFTLELESDLKQYFPSVLQLVQSRLYAQFICRLLLRWPTLAELQKAERHALRKFFYANNLRGDHIEQKLGQIYAAQALTDDHALLSAGVRRAQKLAQLILVLNHTIDDYEKQMDKLLKAHADYPIFKSLPGAGLQRQARLLGCNRWFVFSFSSGQRGNYQNAPSGPCRKARRKHLDKTHAWVLWGELQNGRSLSTFHPSRDRPENIRSSRER